MKVILSSPLRSYSGGQSQVEAEGASVSELLADLERQFPGIRFRMISEQDQIREHIRIFVNAELTQSLDTPLQPSDTVHVITSISGG